MTNTLPGEEARALLAGFVAALTNGGRNRENQLSISHDQLHDLVKRSQKLLTFAHQSPSRAAGIPDGMKPWHGGFLAPEDWDPEGDMICRNGLRLNGGADGEPFWEHTLGGGDLVAYTPKATPQTVPANAEPSGREACDIVADLRTFAMNMRRDDSDARSDDLRFYYEAIEGFADSLDAALATPAELPALPSREEIARRSDALAQAFCLLDTLAGDGLGHTYGNGQTIMADDAVSEIAEAFEFDCEPGWWRTFAAALAQELAALHPPASVAEVEGLREALKPFADIADEVPSNTPNAQSVTEMSYCSLTIGDCRKARKALRAMPSGEKG